MGVIVQNIIKCYFSFFLPLDPALLRQLVNSWRENQLFWKITILKLTSRSRWCSLYTVRTWQSYNLHRYVVAK